MCTNPAFYHSATLPMNLSVSLLLLERINKDLICFLSPVLMYLLPKTTKQSCSSLPIPVVTDRLFQGSCARGPGKKSVISVDKMNNNSNENAIVVKKNG